MKVITDDQIRQLILPRLTLASILHSQAVAFHSLSSSQCPSRLSLITPSHTQLFMPARTDTSVIKIVCVPLPSSGLSGIPGTNLVLDNVTGKLSHVVDSSCLTALRTAAGSLLSSVIALRGWRGQVERAVCFGDGQQAVFHVWLHWRFFASLREVTVVVGLHRNLKWEEVVEKRQRFVDQLEKLGAGAVKVRFLTAAEDQEIKTALRNASLVFTCTPSTIPLFSHTDLGGTKTHICAIGSYKPHMCELPPHLVRSASRVMVDSVEACAGEAGCLIQAFPREKELKGKCVELRELLPSTEAGSEGFMAKLEEYEKEGEGKGKGKREEQEGVTVFKSVGVGLQDVEITKCVVATAEVIGGVGSDVAF